jgi:hypothetical protein
MMEGLHKKRVGEIRMLEKILTIIEEAHAVDRTLEREHIRARTKADQKRISEMGTGACTGLRGEEMSLIDLHGTAKSVARFMKKESVDPHFKFVTLGRTRGVQENGHKFAIPCVKETQGAHLRPGIWLERLIAVKEELHRNPGRPT